MNAADLDLLRWLDMEIRTGKKVVRIPADLLANTTPEALREARSLAILSGVKLELQA